MAWQSLVGWQLPFTPILRQAKRYPRLSSLPCFYPLDHWCTGGGICPGRRPGTWFAAYAGTTPLRYAIYVRYVARTGMSGSSLLCLHVAVDATGCNDVLICTSRKGEGGAGIVKEDSQRSAWHNPTVCLQY